MAKETRPRLGTGDIVGGRYRIDGVVGRGGFGAVYRASHLTTGDQVALKVLLKSLSSTKVDSKRFRREAALVQKLRHHNVVELLDFGETERGQPFIAFELLHGKALGNVLKATGSLPLWHAGEIARDVLRALEAAHRLGIVHRDIKPQNVFLCEGEVGSKVLDFGIAKAVSGEEAGATQLTEAGQMIGTPHYMAPEQIRGTGVGPATDLYATGLLMAEMIGGERVVKGDSLIDIYMIHISDEPLEFMAAVSDSPLSDVIERATHKVTAKRYGSATEMLFDLLAALPGLAQAVSPEMSAAKTTQMRQVDDMVAESGDASADSDELLHTHLVSAPRGAARPAVPTGTVQMAMPDIEQIAQGAQQAGDSVEPAPLSPHPLEETVDMIDLPVAAEQSAAEDDPWSTPEPSSDGFSEKKTSHMPARGQVSVVPALPLGSVAPAPTGFADPTTPDPGQPYTPLRSSQAPSVGMHISGEHVLAPTDPLQRSGEYASYSGEHASYSGEHPLSSMTAQPSLAAPLPVAESRFRWVLMIIAVVVLALAIVGVLVWQPW